MVECHPGPSPSLIERLLAKGASLGLRNTRNPLLCIEHSATSQAFVDVLLRHGVDPNASDSEGYTPLMKFAYEGNEGAVQKLLSNGAQVNFRSANGRTALEEAVSRARRRREFLVIRRARPHARESCDSWLPPRPGYSIPCLDCICWSKAVAGSAGPSD